MNNWLESPVLPQYWAGELSIDIPKGYTLNSKVDGSVTIEMKDSVATISGTGNCTLWYEMCGAQSKTASCYLFTLADTKIYCYTIDDVCYCSLSNDTDIRGTLYYRIDNGKDQIYTGPFIIGTQGTKEVTKTIYTTYKYNKFIKENNKSYTIETYKIGEVSIDPEEQTFSESACTIKLEGKGDISYKIDNKTFTYTKPFEINKDTEITYWSTKNGVTQKDKATKQYIYLPQPKIFPFVGGLIQIDYQRTYDPPKGYNIYKKYSIGYGDPVEYGDPIEYTKPFSVNKDCTIKAVHTCLKENVKIGEVITEEKYTIEQSSSPIKVFDENGNEFGDTNIIEGYLHKARITGTEPLQYRLYEEGSTTAYTEYTEEINLRVESAATNLVLEVKDGKNNHRKLTFQIKKGKIPNITLSPSGLDIKEAAPSLDEKIDVQLAVANIPKDITFTITYQWNGGDTQSTNKRTIPLQEGTLKVTLSSDYYIGTSTATGTYQYNIKTPTFIPGYYGDAQNPYCGLRLQAPNASITILNNAGVGNIQYRYKFCESSVQLQTALDKEYEGYGDWIDYNSENGVSITWQTGANYYILEARVVYTTKEGVIKYSNVSKIYYEYYVESSTSPSNNVPEPEVFPASGTFDGPITITMVGKNTIMYQIDNDGNSRTYSMPIDQVSSITLTAWQVEGNRESDKVVRKYDIDSLQ